MRKKGKLKMVAVFIAAIITMNMSAIFATGCSSGRTVDGEKIDAKKSQLFIQNYDGGGGSRWLYDVKERFEEANKNVSFEEGKVGVQLMITPNKVVGTAFTPSASSQEVVFIEAMSYFDYASMGEMLDITDIAEEVLAQDGVDIDPEYLAALRAIDKNNDGKGEIYALPHYEFYGGVAYNKSVWNQYELYFEGGENGEAIKDAGEEFGYVFTNARGDLSRGPDKIMGTSDDGLAETWEEFFHLLDYMTARGVSPFIISGLYAHYFYYFCYSAFAAYGGFEQVNSCIAYNGDIEYVKNVSMDTNSPIGLNIVSENATISNSTGYLSSKLTGKLVALAAAEQILKKDGNQLKYFYQPGLLGTVSHLDAQEMFINSQYYNKPIAMLIDGSWWENEATEAFESIGKISPEYSKMNSNYGWMQLPRVIDKNDNRNVELCDYDLIRGYGFINANIAPQKIKLAKDFMRFCYSLDELRAYTETTGLPRGLKYELTEENLSKMSSYAKDLWQYKNGRKIVHPISDNPLTIYESVGIDNMWTSKLYGGPCVTMYKETNALGYFNDLEIAKSTWDSKYSKYFETLR